VVVVVVVVPFWLAAPFDGVSCAKAKPAQSVSAALNSIAFLMTVSPVFYRRAVSLDLIADIPVAWEKSYRVGNILYEA
jgi:hypothetical protein